jgi:hypothetical protein
VPSSGRWETSGMGTPTECWTLSTSEFPSAGAVSSSLADVLEEPGQPHLRKYFLSPRAAVGILRRASRRGRSLPDGLREALEGLAASTEQGGGVVPAVTAKWAKGSGGPSGDEVQNLVVNALTSSMAGAGGGVDDNTAQGGHLVVVREDGPFGGEVQRREPPAGGLAAGGGCVRR